MCELSENGMCNGCKIKERKKLKKKKEYRNRSKRYREEMRSLQGEGTDWRKKSDVLEG